MPGMQIQKLENRYRKLGRWEKYGEYVLHEDV